MPVTTKFEPPEIYDPKPNSEIDVERHKTITLQWKPRGTPHKSIVLNIGTEEGKWDIIQNAPVGNPPRITLDAGLFPSYKPVFVQLVAEIDGDEKNEHGETVSEYIASEAFRFNCKKRSEPEPAKS